MPVRILIGDSATGGLQQACALLEAEGFEVLGRAGSGHDAVDLAVRLRPDVAILDSSAPQMNALEAACDMCNLCSGTRVILLTQDATEEGIVAAFRAGIRGYVMTADTASDLARAIREVCGGRLFLSPGACRGLTDPYLPGPATPPPVIP